MPARFLLIDGYNLMHAAGMARETYGPGDLKRCRERLLRYLAHKLTPAQIERTTVVFDARDPPGDRPARQNIGGLTVLFAGAGGDADLAIQEWLDQHSAPKRVTVVSSDHALQRAARRRGAQYVDSEPFFETLKRRRAGSHRAVDEEKPERAVSDTEAARWSAHVGDLADLAPEAADNSAPPDTMPGPEGSAKTPDAARAQDAAPAKKTRRSRHQPRRSDKDSADDLAYWMSVFGSLREASELNRQRPEAELEKWLRELGDLED
ncbi:MAG: NYN domain-containing protein [Planctomycetaceae bacterium]